MSDTVIINPIRVTIRWVLLLGSLLAVGPLAAALIAPLRDATGGGASTPLVSASPITGILGIALAFTLAALVGCIGGRLFGPRLGLRCAGLALAWVAWQTGTLDAIVRSNDASSVLTTLTIEGAIVGVAMLAAAAAILFFSRPASHDEAADFPTSTGLFNALARALRPSTALAILGGVIGGGIVAWIFAISPLKGQAVFSAIFAGIATGAVARLAGSAIDDDPSPLAPWISTALLAIAAPLAGSIMHGNAILDAVYAAEVFAPARILPLDYIAGGIIGVPTGLAWAGSMMEKQTDKHPAANAA